MKYVKHMGRLAPKALRSLIIILVVILAATSTAAIAARGPVTPSSPVDRAVNTEPLIARAPLPGVYTVPSSCSVPIIPALLTPDEIELREYQADFAKYIEEQATQEQEINLTAQRDVLAIERFRLDCEIMLLQARQLLDSDTSILIGPKVTDQEIELRKRQVQLAQQIDDKEIVSHEAGVASLNRVWTARRARIDAEILLLQATVKQRLQTRQGDADLGNEPI
ncbi:MAG: hypothetical protein AAGI69_01885 [Cyanobacteria bacterium P01_H01_bin.21]